MGKNIDLTGKILINDHFQITIGRFLFVMIVTILQFVAMLLANQLVLSPAMLFLFTNMMFSIEKRYDKTELIEERLDLLESDKMD